MDRRIIPLIFAATSLALLTGCIGSPGGAAVSQPPLEVQKSVVESQSSAVPPSEINWINSYEEGLKVAQEKNKPILLYFWAVWCSFCAKMDKEVLSDGEIIKLMTESFVPVLLDVDNEDNFKYFNDYKVVGTPTFVILNPKGELLRGTVGYKTKEEFMTFLRGG